LAFLDEGAAAGRPHVRETAGPSRNGDTVLLIVSLVLIPASAGPAN